MPNPPRVPPDDLLHSAQAAAATPNVREAVRDVALSALCSRLLTPEHIAAVARTIGEGIESVDVPPTAPVRETTSGAWAGLEEAVDRALHALELATREFAEGRARLTPAERDQMVADIAGLEGALAVGWNHRHRVPDGLTARITVVTGLLRRAVATEAVPGEAGPSALGAGRVLSFVASGVLLGLTEALAPQPR